ncbi:MAG: lasso peptide biosynthesis B2 protein [Gammaproteobacteria bacterium]|nr:lasso peptide biosynthesis B2 protein [Gammaproteobacteria bacterium]
MWRSFDWRDHWLAVQAGSLASLLELLLRCTSLQYCQRLLKALRPAPEAADSAFQPALVHHLADVIGFGARRYTPFPTACLARSLLLQHFLARRGIGASLCLGTRIDKGEFSAHAWVEYLGMPLGEGQAPRELYAPFEQ